MIPERRPVASVSKPPHLVFWNDLDLRSTHTRPLCPECLRPARPVPLGFVCVGGCGWKWIVGDTEGY